jgi:hypothetical protein
MPKLFVNINHLIAPNPESIYTLEKRKWKLFLFNRKEYYDSKKQALKRIADLNRELSDLCVRLSDLTAEIYSIYRMDYFTLDDRRKERIRISFIDFDKSFHSIKFRSQYPDGAFLAFMIFHNCSDILAQILDDIYRDQRSAYIRTNVRLLKKTLENINQLTNQLNGPETIN